MCASPFEFFKGRCLAIQYQAVSWDQAKTLCQELDAQLIKVDSDRFSMDLRDYLWACEW